MESMRRMRVCLHRDARVYFRATKQFCVLYHKGEGLKEGLS